MSNSSQNKKKLFHICTMLLLSRLCIVQLVLQLYVQHTGVSKMTIMSYFIKNPSSGGGVKKPGLFRLFVPQKPIPLKIPHDFFLITPSPLLEISLSSINLPCLDFYWNSPVAYLNNKRNYFSPHMHLIHISCVILIYNMKIIWSL